MNTYQKNAQKFAKNHGIKLVKIGEPVYKKYFSDDKDCRWVFKMKLSRNGKSYTFNFGQSLKSGSETPDIYSVLSCLQKYDVGSFDDFCSEFGYDVDSIKTMKSYKAVCREFAAVQRLFGDILDDLQNFEEFISLCGQVEDKISEVKKAIEIALSKC